MFYKPKFCCNCGEKVEREEWRITDSRRFCQLCETEFKGADYLPRVIVAAGLVLSLFGFSSMLTGSSRTVNSAISPMPKAALKPAAAPKVSSPANTVADPESAGRNPQEPAAEKTREQPTNPQISSENSAFSCGFPTKKGTPCSRKVKAKGLRCWQHADK